MGFEIHLEKPKIYQVHDRIYLEQEIRIKPPTLADLLGIKPKSLVNSIRYLSRRTLRIKLPTEVDSLFFDGAELSKIEVFPIHLGAKLERGSLKLRCGHLTKEVNTIRLGMQFVLPPDKLYNSVTAQLLERAKKDNGYAFTFLVKNRKDWRIEYVKMHLQIITKKALKRTDLFRVDLEAHLKHELSRELSTNMSHLERFDPLDSRTYLLEVEFDNEFDPDAQIEIYINDSSLTKCESIVFVPGSMVESLKKFYDLLATLEGDVWWFEEHMDKDCFYFFSNGINKERVTNIRMLGGPVHMNEQFKQFYAAFKKDMSSHKINVEVKAVLDEKTLELMHGRFLFDNSRFYSVPSSNIVSKKFDAVALVSDIQGCQRARSEVQEIWRNSTPISKWDKIQEMRQSLTKSAF